MALVRLENGIWASVEKHGSFVDGIHGNYELTGNINECQDFGNGIWVVENF